MRHSNNRKGKNISFVKKIDRELVTFYVDRRSKNNASVFPEFPTQVQA